ncbi:amidohydrolase family protein [Burkholderia multivorans]|uniref:amidohydrolase family protein n=1 Tax=Burkholderia multivorans TaxID=87883 RepID=UPI001C217CB8|nr:amidohydrolase family protein [Burkholderia multivorans]
MSETKAGDWVDSHFHVFNRQELSYGWLDEYSDALHQLLGDYRPLNKAYPPSDYFADARPAGLTKAIHCEAVFGANPIGETAWLQSVADQSSIPLAIIAWADLTVPDIESQLDQHCAYPAFRGVRMLWGADAASSRAFRRGYEALATRNLIYEVASLWNNCFEDVARLADDFPHTQIVLQHLGLPIQHDDAYLSGWRRAMAHLGKRSNIACKLSGFGMFDHAWTVERMRPYVHSVVEAFGTDRCVFGSNWPVDSLYGRSYVELIDAYRDAILDQTPEARTAMLSGNASRIYRI